MEKERRRQISVFANEPQITKKELEDRKMFSRFNKLHLILFKFRLSVILVVGCMYNSECGARKHVGNFCMADG